MTGLTSPEHLTFQLIIAQVTSVHRAALRIRCVYLLPSWVSRSKDTQIAVDAARPPHPLLRGKDALVVDFFTLTMTSLGFFLLALGCVKGVLNVWHVK